MDDESGKDSFIDLNASLEALTKLIREHERESDCIFADEQVMRLLRIHLNDNKRIGENVSYEFNKFLSLIVKTICGELNKYPQSWVTDYMIREVVFPYVNVFEINEEKARILHRLSAIESDCTALQEDIKSIYLSPVLFDETKDYNVWGHTKEKRRK